MDFKSVGTRIKNKRLELKLTQEELGEMTGLTDTYIGAIERANSKCSIETLVKIANALQLNMDYLLLGTTIQNVDNHFSEVIKKLPKDKRNIYIELCDSIAETLSK